MIPAFYLFLATMSKIQERFNSPCASRPVLVSLVAETLGRRYFDVALREIFVSLAQLGELVFLFFSFLGS
jgi:hypothetical protein